MTGWRIGYAAGPADWIAAAAAIQSHQTGNACSISQEAAGGALEAGGEESESMRRIFESRRNLVASMLGEVEGLELWRPEGTFYAFPRIARLLGRHRGGPDLESDTDLASWLLAETGVATVAGSAFYAPGHLRISFACSEETLKEGLNRLRMAFASLGPPRVRGN
jgi:aspartate aminotransferase